jgi:5-methylcytosine-specific restriction endonuclease McrA
LEENPPTKRRKILQQKGGKSSNKKEENPPTKRRKILQQKGGKSSNKKEDWKDEEK